MPRHHKKIIDVASAIVLLTFIALDAAAWRIIFGDMTGNSIVSGLYFFPVTQGESALLVLPGGITVLTDAGSDAGIIDDLQMVMPAAAPSYIDVAIISYPQEADYAGYQYLLQHYRIGAFIYNGQADGIKNTEWQALLAAITTKHIPLVTLGAGDSIRYGGAAKIDILSPNKIFAHSPDPADTGLVQYISTPAFSALLAADVGTNVESALLARGDGADNSIKADIIKAPFPGVGTAAGDAFLRAVAPRAIVVEPGVKNTASQPTKSMLAHLASSTNAAVAAPKRGSFLLYNK